MCTKSRAKRDRSFKRRNLRRLAKRTIKRTDAKLSGTREVRGEHPAAGEAP